MTPTSNTQVIPQVIPTTPESNTQVIPQVPPAPVSSGYEAAHIPSSSGPMLGNTGNTQTEVIPVLPTLGNTEVNPVIQGNMAGLPPVEPEGNTEGTVSKSYKLPVWVIPTMERVITEINKVLPFGTPPVTMHSYGVDVLTRHEELRKAAQQSQYFKECYSVASAQLQLAQSDLAKLKAQPSTETVPTAQESVVPSVTPPTDDTWYNRYQSLQSELKSTRETLQLEKDAARPLYDFFEVLPAVVEQLCQEAAAQSWRKPAYFQQFFQELIAPYLERK